VTVNYLVEAGQHYRTVGAPGTQPIVWEVVAVYVPWQGGFEHARLRSLDLRAETMTLAPTVVVDKTRFTCLD
jgi:hypothetical protein